MARFCIPLFVREKIQVLLDLRDDLFGRKIFEPGSCQQNAQGIPIQQFADVYYCHGIVGIEREAGTNLGSFLQEQTYGPIVLYVFQSVFWRELQAAQVV